MDQSNESILAIVGGGRWGRVLVSVLASLDLPFDRVLIVSKFNAELIQNYLSNQIPENKRSIFSLLPSMERFLRSNAHRAAIVVNNAGQHFSTASSLIASGSHVLIEKPVALTIEHARTLIDQALVRNICLVPGLNYRFCSYLHHFAKTAALLGPFRTFLIEWSDALGENRYGEKKSYDPQVDIAQDIMPHIWATLFTLFGRSSLEITDCQTNRDGLFAVFFVQVKGGAEGRVVLEREASERRRKASIKFVSGEVLSIDFSIEPGIICQGDEILPGSSEWDTFPKPLARQLTHFFSRIAIGTSAKEDLEACLNSVSFSETASIHLRGRLQPFSPLNHHRTGIFP